MYFIFYTNNILGLFTSFLLYGLAMISRINHIQSLIILNLKEINSNSRQYMQDKYIQFSQFLSYVLRHKPESISLTLNTEGWVSVDNLLLQANRHGKKLTREILEYVVENNNKKRFTFNDDHSQIRAAQGHSTQQVRLNHVSQTPPKFLYHGTATRFVDSIRQQGLLAGNRHHVHLSDNIDTATRVGARHGNPIVLVIEAQKMVELGYLFYLSDNHVWLTEHVPAQFIQQS